MADDFPKLAAKAIKEKAARQVSVSLNLPAAAEGATFFAQCNDKDAKMRHRKVAPKTDVGKQGRSLYPHLGWATTPKMGLWRILFWIESCSCLPLDKSGSCVIRWA